MFQNPLSNSKSKSAREGFSLIELLVVATIMIVLTTIGIVSYQQASKSSRNAKRKADLEVVRQALVLYRTDFGTYPSGAGSNGAFTAMLTTISDYLSIDTMEDPKNTGLYIYIYTSDGVTFSTCTYLEDATPTQYCTESP